MTQIWPNDWNDSEVTLKWLLKWPKTKMSSEMSKNVLKWALAGFLARAESVVESA